MDFNLSVHLLHESVCPHPNRGHAGSTAWITQLITHDSIAHAAHELRAHLMPTVLIWARTLFPPTELFLLLCPKW